MRHAQVKSQKWEAVRRELIRLSVFLIPLLAGIIAVIVVKAKEVQQAKLSAAAELLAPPVNYAPVITVLAAFLVAYVVFLLLMFYDNLHEIVLRLEHRLPRYSRRSKWLFVTPILLGFGAMIYAQNMKVQPFIPAGGEQLSPIGSSALVGAIFLIMALYVMALVFIFVRSR